MSRIWNFPLSLHTQNSGTGGTGLDQFSGAPYNNLAREIIQNSLDARRNENEPVVVEFHSFCTTIENVPGIDSLADYALRMYNQYSRGSSVSKEDKTVAQNAIKAIQQKKVQWLRISDFMTTGLWGSSQLEDQNTAWFAFIHGTGRNQKRKKSGGSKGLGKNAIFVNSIIRSLFVSTYAHNKKNESEEIASIGIAKLLSITDQTDKSPVPDWTQGVGYCVDDTPVAKKYNSPTNDFLNIDSSFDREAEGYGTDIFLPFFTADEDWQYCLIYETLISFMPAIYNGDLTVKITSDGPFPDLIIDAYNLVNRINDLPLSSSWRKEAKGIYDVLNSNMTQTIVYKTNKPGFEMRLLLLQSNKDGLNTVYTYRFPTKMRIQKYNPPSSAGFTGVLYIEGDEICERLRAVEDATHSKWYVNKHKDSGYERDKINEAINAVEQFIFQECSRLGTEGTAEYVNLDIAGWNSEEEISTMSPEKQEEFGLPSSEVVFDSKVDSVKNSKRPRKRKSNRIDDKGNVESEIEDIGTIGEGDKTALPPEGHNEGKGGEYHAGGGEEKFDPEKGTQIVIARRRVATVKSQMPAINPKEGLFDLIITPEKTCNDAFIEIVKSGVEGESESVTILAASSSDFEPKIVNNKIHVERLEKHQTYKVSVKLDEARNYIWEVNIDAED